MFRNIDIFSSPFLDICAFRLDFETFQTEGPSTFTEASGGACVDTFQVTTVNIWPYIHCEFEHLIRNRKISKYLEVSKWKNEVMVIKNTPNKNDWPRAILEKRQEKKFSS